ncbi:efflux RND transporter periplasmic adaptor subunit [Pinisolibacter aquiterrae]|uniref:efflux RND transporter periplasmic adaptor subunit n=1 Tax=Pinisolibacter aquiterrae TaxID=2815579 RepID=UPI001C3C9176|nr:efflux RND transporter periplasmic adaptor subunit [Pinisolibacter aquiterrae]MBV5263072.1 efflux RND transporter periplasmic adaptor subunit [Pinisolibacter aquiterrae]MCC8233988.1 efflux RND transporter periplasmic adaptor subunit [Pinisolibacter aquiterrae]
MPLSIVARPLRRTVRRIGSHLPAAAVLAAALGLTALVSPVRAAETVTVAEVSVDDAKEVLATVESVRTPQARTRIGGTLTSVAVTEGDGVKKGDVLAVVEDPKLKLQLTAAQARIGALEAKLGLVQMELDRVRQLRFTGAAPQSRLDDSETQLTVTQAEIAAARADKSVIEEQVIEGRVLAPDDGRVLKVSAVAGQVVMPGEPIATIAIANYILKLRLPERHARFMHEGDEVVIAGRGLDRTTDTHMAKGKIVRVYPELDQGRVVADVEAGMIGDYFVGERVSVFVATGKRQTIIVPQDVVINREGLTFVRLAGVGEVPVQTGAKRATADGSAPGVEILTGLKVGDEVLRP